jgi:hypothetical protein
MLLVVRANLQCSSHNNAMLTQHMRTTIPNMKYEIKNMFGLLDYGVCLKPQVLSISEQQFRNIATDCSKHFS